LVEIIGSVAERVDICDLYAVGQLRAGDNACSSAPSIVAVCAYNSTVLIGNGNNIALQVLLEVVRHAVVNNAADGLLVVIDGDEDVLVSLGLLIIVPALTQDLGAVQNVIVLDTVHRLAGTNTVGIVGVGVAVKALQLTALLPGQGVAQIRGRIALPISVYCHFR